MVTECIVSKQIDQHLKSIDSNSKFENWLADYELSKEDHTEVLDRLLEDLELLTVLNAVQFLLANDLAENELLEMQELTDKEPDHQLHHLAAFVDEMDTECLAISLEKAYSFRGDKFSHFLWDYDTAIENWVDSNEDSLYEKFMEDDHEQ